MIFLSSCVASLGLGKERFDEVAEPASLDVSEVGHPCYLSMISGAPLWPLLVLGVERLDEGLEPTRPEGS